MTVYVDDARIPARRYRSKTPEALPGEEWRAIQGFPGYLVSNLGRTWGPRGRVLRGNPIRGGYLLVKLYGLDGSATSSLVHRLVGTAFLGPCPEGQEVNHKNGNTADNRVANLEYATHGNNVKHAYRELNARGARGSRSGHTRLTEGQVIEIRSRYAVGGVSAAQLGRDFGVSTSVAGDIIRRRTWRSAEADHEADLTDPQRLKAIELGAVPIGIRDMGALMSARRRGETWAGPAVVAS